MRSPGIDYRGARGSNAGDAFHELWAVRQALRLLDGADGLAAITVEGVSAGAGGDAHWDAVDCALLYGGETLAEAERVEIQQLKYSAATPNRSWTVARLCAGRDGRAATSPIRKLAKAFSEATKARAGKRPDSIEVALVTNQPILPELKSAFEKARKGEAGGADLDRLGKASGLSHGAFRDFASAMRFFGRTGSRFAVEEAALGEIAQWADTELAGIADRLRDYVRRKMLPEATGEAITRESILLAVGVSDESVLFPCPSEFAPVENAVPRAASRQIAEAMERGARKVCLHGAAGVGKTTALREVVDLLPPGSEAVLFDCYGAGSYLDASRTRHRPREAFPHLSNDLARRLRLPALLEPNKAQDHARAFRRRLEAAADTLAAAHPGALLVIAVDAADNAIAAARETGGDPAFVTELMSFGDLPENVRLAVSARTGRLDDLKPPADFERIEIGAFTREETGRNVARHWADAPEGRIEDFHRLSGGVPRVQAYALGRAGGDPGDALAALRPAGKDLATIFDERFAEACAKHGDEAFVARVCAGLIVLPRPIPVSELAAVLDVSPMATTDICNDLAPGIQNRDGFLGLADEDFENHLRERAGVAADEIRAVAAERLSRNASSDEYAAAHVANLLRAAGRNKELLDLVEREPEPDARAVPDPVRRREIHDGRLLAAIGVCRAAGDSARALRFVAIGAEAKGTDEAFRDLLAAHPRLTARFARDTGGRLILGDRARIAQHGPLLCHMMAEDAARGDAVGVRENWRRLNAWFDARDARHKARAEHDHDDHDFGFRWQFGPEDGAALVYATACLDGAEAALRHFSHVRPLRFAIRVGEVVVERLLAERRFDLAEEIAAKCRPSRSVFLLVPLARAGRRIDVDRLARGLAVLAKRFPSDPKKSRRFGAAIGDEAPESYVADTMLSAAEILAGRGVHRTVCETVLTPFLDPEFRRIDKRRASEHDIPALDAILRSWCLAQAMDGRPVRAADVLTPSPDPEPKDRKRPDAQTRYADEEERKLRSLLEAIAPLYVARANAIVSSEGNKGKSLRIENIVDSLPSYNLFHNTMRNDSWGFRERLSSMMVDLMAIGANAGDVADLCFGIRERIFPGNDFGMDELCARLYPIPATHDRLLSTIVKAIAIMQDERSSGTDKADSLADLAELSIPIDKDETTATFQGAIDAIGELNIHTMDRFYFLDAVSGNAQNTFAENRVSHASKAAAFVAEAAVRLRDYSKYFPWTEAMSTVARLDVPTALAAAARWDDSEVAYVHTTLPAAISFGLKTGYPNAAQAAALLGLNDWPDTDALRSVMEKAVEEGRAAAMAEEFARDTLTERISGSAELEAFIAEHGDGYWARRYVEQSEFLRTLPYGRKGEGGTAPAHRLPVASFVETHAWRPEVFSDGRTLLDEAEMVLEAVREAKGFASLGDILERAIEFAPSTARRQCLDALADILRQEKRSSVADAILKAATDWGDQPSIARWRKEKLPAAIAESLPAFVGPLPWEDDCLGPALQLAGLSDAAARAVLLEGIERNADRLDVRKTFALAGAVAAKLAPEDAAGLRDWYIDRLFERIPAETREAVPPAEIPDTAAGGVGRFLYACMGDIDLRQRWRAAHALRRLARLGETETIAEIVACYGRTEEPAFRMGEAPFYWLAARLWLVIALDRIAEETPDAAAPHGRKLLDIALDDAFPHLLVRDYAADACRKLVAAGRLPLEPRETEALARVNAGTPGTSVHTGSSYDLYHPYGDIGVVEGRRFRFDGVDTLRYWYAGWLEVFENLTMPEFLDAAENWIVDKWGVRPRPGDKWPRPMDPRPERSGNRHYRMHRNSHGTIPTVDEYAIYLEWHAMWCAAGQLLETHRLRPSEPGRFYSLASEKSAGKPTHPPYWLSDFVGPRPLQRHRWREDAPTDEGWLDGIEDDDFLRELFPADRPDRIVAEAWIETELGAGEEKISVSTALVSPDTARALVRALQTAENHWDFHLCPEGHEHEIAEPDYLLRGWLAENHGDSGYDDKDPYRNRRGFATLPYVPGAAVTAALGLERRLRDGRVEWVRAGGEPAFVHEAWGRREDEEDRVSLGFRCSGRRLSVGGDDLAAFLEARGLDLIAEVTITRREGRPGERSHDPQNARNAAFDRIFLLRRSGAVELAERCLEPWRPDRP